MKVSNGVKKGVAMGLLGACMVVPCFADITASDKAVIKQGLNSYSTKIEIRNKNTSQDELINFIKSERIYNVTSFKVSKNSNKIYIYPSYYETKESMSEVRMLASLVAEEVYGYTPKEKVYYITQRIGELLEYSKGGDGENLIIFSPTAVIEDGVGVCQSYARLADIFFTYAGLETKFIEGTINSTPHLWNAVKIDNEWFAVDVTSADNDETDKINFNFVLMSVDDMQSNGYTITFNPVSISKSDVALFDEAGLVSIKDKKFYSTIESSEALLGTDYQTKKLSVMGSGDNYWVVGGELFIKKENDIINVKTNEIYYSGLNATDVVSSKDSELYVNNSLIYNGTHIPASKVAVIKGDFKVSVNDKSFQHLFSIKDSINKVNIFYKELFLIQYLKIK